MTIRLNPSSLSNLALRLSLPTFLSSFSAQKLDIDRILDRLGQCQKRP